MHGRSRRGLAALVALLAVLLLSPAARAAWTAIGPDYAGVYALEHDPFDDNVIWAGTFYGGVFRSRDNGLTWAYVDSPASGHHVQTIAVDRNRQGTVFAGTYQFGISRTTDGGATWQAVNQGLGDLSITSIAIDPFDSTHVVAASALGAYESRDSGTTWTKLSTGPTEYLVTLVAFDPVRRGHLYLGTVLRGIVRTVDGGANWGTMNEVIGETSIRSLRFDAAGTRLYATSYNGTVGRAFRLRLDAGPLAWQDITYDLPATVVNDAVAFAPLGGRVIASTNFGVYELQETTTPTWRIFGFFPARLATTDRAGTKLMVATLDRGLQVATNLNNQWTPANRGLQNHFIEALTTVRRGTQSRVLAGSDLGVYVSDDQGTRWSNPGNFIATVFEVQQHPTKPDVLFAGAQDIGLFKSVDSGASWSSSANGIVPPQVSAVAQSPGGARVLYSATSTGLFTSRDDGQTWVAPTLVPILNVTTIAFDPFRPAVAFFGNASGRVSFSVDEGITYSEVSAGLPARAVRSLAITARDGFFPITYAVCDDGRLYALPDGATTWFPLDTGSTIPALAVAALKSSPQTIYLATAGGGVLKSDDYGATFAPRNQGLGSLVVTTVAPDRTGTRVYAATATGLFVSADAGANWARADAGLPSGGSVLRLVPDPVDDNVVYALIAGSGLYRTTNRGVAWAQVATPADASVLVSFDAHPATPGKLYLGTSSRGVYASVNAGVTWATASRGMTLFAKGIAIDPAQPSRMYAGALFGGMFRSTDEGASWRGLGLADRVIFKVALAPDDPNTVYAATGGGVARSRDNGDTWAILGQRTAFVSSIAARRRAGANDVLYVGGNNGGLFRSTDGGTLFSDINAGLPAATVVAIDVDPGGTLYAALSGRGVYRSTDDGASWQQVLDVSWTGRDITHVLVVPATGRILAPTDGAGIFISSDAGATWGFQVQGLSSLDVRHLAIDPFAPSRVFAATAAGVDAWDSSDLGQAWLAAATLPAGSVRVNHILLDERAEGTIFAASEGGLFKSEDRGATWTDANRGLFGAKVHALAIDRCNITLMYAGTRGDGMFRSRNGGGTWEAINDGIAAPEIAALATTSTPGKILAGTVGGGLQRSVDEGTTWLGGIGGAVLPVVHALGLSALEPGLIYAGTGDFGVVKSTNGGDDWMVANNGLTDLQVFSLAVDPVNPRVVYAGTRDSGVFHTRDGGTTWSQLPTEGLYNKWVVSLAIDPADRRVIYAGTEGSGVFRMQVADFAADVPDAPLGVAALPGNGQATVSFTAPRFDGGSAITGYTVTAQPGGLTFNGSASPIVASGLANGTRYTFTVTARNAAGAGAASERSNGVTPSATSAGSFGVMLQASPPNTGRVVSAPAGLDCTAGPCAAPFASGTSVTLTASVGTAPRFLGWTGCDSCDRNQCRVTVNGLRDVVAGFALDPNGDQDGDGLPNAIEFAEGRDPLVKDNDVFGSPRLFVMQQYRDFLGREGEPAGIDGWTGHIVGRTLTPGQVAQAFFDSTEFSLLIAPVARLYFAYFLRVPDAGGLRFWVSRFKAGDGIFAISNAFASSPETVARYGNLDDSNFVHLVYRNVLGRPADPDGLNFWLGQLASGTMTRGELMTYFSESPEYKADIANEVFVTMAYLALLQRMPEPGGFSYWVSYIDAGNPPGTLLDLILGTQEYHNRFLPP